LLLLLLLLLLLRLRLRLLRGGSILLSWVLLLLLLGNLHLLGYLVLRCSRGIKRAVAELWRVLHGVRTGRGRAR